MRITFYQPKGELTSKLVADMLNMVSVSCEPGDAENWTRIERIVAYDWAIREHMIASDNFSIKSRPRPTYTYLERYNVK